MLVFKILARSRLEGSSELFVVPYFLPLFILLVDIFKLGSLVQANYQFLSNNMLRTDMFDFHFRNGAVTMPSQHINNLHKFSYGFLPNPVNFDPLKAIILKHLFYQE